jgi:NAD(P)-dependent dehydrogenase (short-subunit alcohol dehydrogenase family)
MPKWTSADLPQMDGRTVVITGAGSGIGLIAARELAGAGARVIAAVRDPARARAALAGAADPARSVEIRQLDVSDLGSVRAFADAMEGTVDVLVNNAGVMDIPLQRTAGGFDLQTATNYFGPFVLTNLLADRITGRVVSVTSQLHRRGRLDLGDLDWRTRAYNPMQAYCDSKLAVVLFSLELQRRLTAAGRPVRSVLAHPGIATTTLAAHSSANRINRLRFLLNDPEHGALPTLYAATQDVPANAYVGPDGLGSIKGYPVVRRPSKAGLDAEVARQLWAATAALTGVSALAAAA